MGKVTYPQYCQFLSVADPGGLEGHGPLAPNFSLIMYEGMYQTRPLDPWPQTKGYD